VFDVGCGNGRLAEVLPKVNYLGIDNSKGLIDQAKKSGRKGYFLVGDALELDKLKTDKFDAVFMFAVLNHIPSYELRQRVLQNVYEILSYGGYLVMTNWNLWRLGKGKNVWNCKIKKTKKQESKKTINLDFKDVMTLWQSGDGERSGELYYRALIKRELYKLFKRTGYKVIENYYSDGEKKAHWWNGRNIVTVGKAS